VTCSSGAKSADGAKECWDLALIVDEEAIDGDEGSVDVWPLNNDGRSLAERGGSVNVRPRSKRDRGLSVNCLVGSNGVLPGSSDGRSGSNEGRERSVSGLNEDVVGREGGEGGAPPNG
jgi:hypothetical protein